MDQLGDDFVDSVSGLADALSECMLDSEFARGENGPDGDSDFAREDTEQQRILTLFCDRGSDREKEARLLAYYEWGFDAFLLLNGETEINDSDDENSGEIHFAVRTWFRKSILAGAARDDILAVLRTALAQHGREELFRRNWDVAPTSVEGDHTRLAAGAQCAALQQWQPAKAAPGEGKKRARRGRRGKVTAAGSDEAAAEGELGEPGAAAQQEAGNGAESCCSSAIDGEQSAQASPVAGSGSTEDVPLAPCPVTGVPLVGDPSPETVIFKTYNQSGCVHGDVLDQGLSPVAAGARLAEVAVVVAAGVVTAGAGMAGIGGGLHNETESERRAMKGNLAVGTGGSEGGMAVTWAHRPEMLPPAGC